MEECNQNEEFKKLMENYDFQSPIKVTLVIEEEDPPDLPSSKDLLVSNNSNIPDTNVYSKSTEVYRKRDSNVDNFKNKIPNGRRKGNSQSFVEKSNHSISTSETFLPSEIQDISLHLLDAVADNLIHITKCFYYNFINFNNQTNDREKLKSEYLTFKHHFFNLSYSTTVSALLPLETNKKFLHNFTQRVIKIAHHSSWFHISYKKLEILIHDMLIWTKQKKKYLDMKLGSHNHKKNNMGCSSSSRMDSNRFNALKQILNRPLNNSFTTNHLSHIYNQLTALSKTHFPVQEMNISSNIKHRNNYSTQEMTSPLNNMLKTNYQTQDITNSNNSTHIINNTVHERTTWQKKLQNAVQRTNYSNQRISNFEHMTNNSTQEISSLPNMISSRINHSDETVPSISNNLPNIDNFHGCQEKNTNRNNILLSAGPPNQKITISIDPEILAYVNQNTNQLNNNCTENHVNETYRTNTIKRRKANDSSYQHCNSNRMSQQDKNNYDLYRDSSRNAECNTDILRSSISRDSGFGSPIYGSCRNEEMIEIANEDQELPIISHVTSMNPTAVILNNGFCTVCGLTTNTMCIGCYQKYYCSPLCQGKDWDIHKYSCSK